MAKVFFNWVILFIVASQMNSYSQASVDFYQIKAYHDAYYDSIMEIKGLYNMQGTGYNSYMRWVDHWESRLYPHGSFGYERAALDSFISSFSGNGENQQSGLGLNWKELGPKFAPDGTDLATKGTGRIIYLELDENDTLYNTLFACSNVGGLWRTTDGGDHWVNCGTDENLPLCGVSSVTIDPDTSSENWFISTGFGEDTPFGISNWQDAIGIYRTTNAGNSWEYIGLKDSCLSMREVRFIRTQSGTRLIVASNKGIYECENPYAVSPAWHLLKEGMFYDIQTDVAHPDIIYTSGTGMTEVYKIDCLADSVSVLQTDGIIPQDSLRRISLRMNTAEPNRLFIFASYYIKGHLDSIYVIDLIADSMKSRGSVHVMVERAMGWNVFPAIINNNQEIQMVYGEIMPVYRTSDLLGTDSLNFTDISGDKIHMDMNYMLVAPDNKTLWVANDGGVCKTDLTDTSYVWQTMINGLSVATVHHAALSEKYPDYSLSGQYDCGTNFYDNIQDTISVKNIRGGDGMMCFFSKANPDIYFASSQDGSIEYYNLQSGTSIKNNGLAMHWHSFFIQNPALPNILYGSSPLGVLRSLNAGQDWDTLSNFPSLTNPNVPDSVQQSHRLGCSPTHANYVYASQFGNPKPQKQRIYKSVDTANTWTYIGSPHEDKFISSIAVDYFNPDIIWVSAGKYVYRVNSITQQWDTIETGLPQWEGLYKLEVLKGWEDALFVSGTYGIFYYDRVLSQWIEVSQGLPNVKIQDVELDQANGRIIASTFGRGVWMSELPCNMPHTGEMVITGDTTWNTDRRIYGNVRVRDTLTIGARICFSPDSRLIIDTGARVIIDGGVLTNLCKTAPWKGIEVWGNPTISQIPGRHGVLEMRNGA